jgi:hypothetical protein
MLREAIQKVMEEIAHHERAAKKHTQMAAALRKDLRDTFAFLQGQEGKGKAAEIPSGGEPAFVAETEPKETAKEEAPAPRKQKGRPKKRGGGKK